MCYVISISSLSLKPLYQNIIFSVCSHDSCPLGQTCDVKTGKCEGMLLILRRYNKIYTLIVFNYLSVFNNYDYLIMILFRMQNQWRQKA